MTTRRDVLVGGVGVGTLLLAGCVEGGGETGTGDTGDGNGNGNGNGNGDGNGTDEGSGDGGDTGGSGDDTGTDTPEDDGEDENATIEVQSSELLQLGPTLGEPDWAREDDQVGSVSVIETKQKAQDSLFGSDDVDTFVEETDFDRALIVSAASVGPDQCHDRIEVKRLEVSDGRLVGEVRVVDTSQENEACAQSLTYPTAAVRVEFSGGVPDEVSMTITDGWGESATYER